MKTMENSITGKLFNIASYALYTHRVALQLARAPLPYPILHIKRRPESIFDYQFEDFEMLNYSATRR